jgi:hypothetical protein
MVAAVWLLLLRPSWDLVRWWGDLRLSIQQMLAAAAAAASARGYNA